MLDNGTCVEGDRLMNTKFQIFSRKKNVIAAE
jgi:hypothetical protein